MFLTTYGIRKLYVKLLSFQLIFSFTTLQVKLIKEWLVEAIELVGWFNTIPPTFGPVAREHCWKSSDPVFNHKDAFANREYRGPSPKDEVCRGKKAAAPSRISPVVVAIIHNCAMNSMNACCVLLLREMQIFPLYSSHVETGS